MKTHTTFFTVMWLSGVILTASLLVSGCGPRVDKSALEQMEARVLYTGCNLFPDTRKKLALSSVNYHLRGAILRWGTAVKITSIDGGNVMLEDVQTGKVYPYAFHGRTLEVTTPDSHLSRFLLEDITPLKHEVDAMPYIDRDGITKAKVLKGMSKRAVLVAIGYPPEFATPDPMNASHWKYWYDRFKQFEVEFDDTGKVIAITGYYPDREK